MRRDGGNARGWATVQGLPRYILIAQRAGASLFYLCYAARRGRPLCLPFFKANAQGWAAAWRLLSAARRGSSLCLPAQSTPGHASHTVHVLMPQGSRQPFRIHPRPRGPRVHPRPRGTQNADLAVAALDQSQLVPMGWATQGSPLQSGCMDMLGWAHA